MADGPERATERALEIAAATHPDVDLTEIDAGVGRELVPLARLPEPAPEARRSDVDGRRVRIRGWVEQRGGPWVEATRPEQIELAERN